MWQDIKSSFCYTEIYLCTTRCDHFLLRLCVSALRSLPSVRRDPESSLQSSSDETCRSLSPPPEAPNTQHCSLPPSGSHDARHPSRLSAGPPDTRPQRHHRLSTSIFLSSSTTTDVCQRRHFLSKNCVGEQGVN